MATPYTPLVMPTLASTPAPTFATTANWIAECAKEVNRAANGFLTSLSELGQIEFSQVGDLPAFDSVVWLGSTYGLLSAMPARPALGLGSIQALLDQLNQLSAPVAPTNNFTYTDPGYASALRDPMISKLLSDMLNGGYGIDDTDEIPLWNRVRDREYKQMQANIEELRRQAAATSAPMPAGALAVAIEKARQESLEKISSANRDIGLKRADLYVEQRRRVIDQVLQSEAQSMTLYNAIQGRALMAAEINTRMAIAVFDASVKLFATRAEVLKTGVDAKVAAAQAEVQLYAADASVFSSFANSIISAAQVQIANSQNSLKRDLAAHASRVELVRFRLQQLGLTLEKNKEIYKYGADFFRTALGSALNGINGLAVNTSEV